MRKLNYALAINEALHQMMVEDASVFLIGQGVKSPWYVGRTAEGLLDRFGPDRVIDTPVSENAMTGAAVGAALAGMRPVAVHPRMDFMLYAFDPIINQAANWSYMNGGKLSAPVVFWCIINRGGEQAAQHSQAIHALFAHGLFGPFLFVVHRKRLGTIVIKVQSWEKLNRGRKEQWQKHKKRIALKLRADERLVCSGY